MFVRIFTVKLKPGEGPGFARTIDQDIIPLMRKFAGFRDEIAMVSTDGKQAVGISFWDRQEDADVYSSDGYPAVIAGLEKLMDGAPVLATYELTNSTAHSVAPNNAGA